MLGSQRWSKARWITCGLLGLATLGLLAAAGAEAWRRHTLPERIASGRVLFNHAWQPADPLANGGDGLGPVFNETSCVACHSQGGVGGSGPKSKNVAAFEVLPTKSSPRVFRGVVHASATRPDLKDSFQLVSARFPVIPGGLTVVAGCVTRQNDFNPVVPSSVNSPALFGAGLIDGLSGWSIHGNGLSRTAQVVAKGMTGDLSGTQVGRVRTLSAGRVGKFGWKGQFATLGDFVASACAVELGLTNPKKAQNVPGEFREDTGAALDMNAQQLRDLIDYVAALPRPREILPHDPTEREQATHGKFLFGETGCAECHTPDLGDLRGVYSDFRLYVIEAEKTTSGYSVVKSPVELADDEPAANEWKTPPLWGVADSAPYFHDGASPTLNDAILRHDASAKESRLKFKKLSPPDRQALFAFLDTLKAPR